MGYHGQRVTSDFKVNFQTLSVTDTDYNFVGEVLRMTGQVGCALTVYHLIEQGTAREMLSNRPDCVRPLRESQAGLAQTAGWCGSTI